MKFIRNWKISLPVAGVVVAGLAWLAFGYFGIHTAFIDDEVAEALPEFDLPAEPATEVAVDGEADAPSADATVTEPSSADEPSTEPEPVAVDEAPTADPVAADDSEQPAVPEVVAEPVEAAAEPQIVTEASGAFAGTSRYDVSGEAVVLGNGTGQRFLRFENFESSNGPDLNVYLVNPDDPNDFVDLGDLKGNIGEQNYEIPVDVDLDRYSQVSIWCVRFGVGFGTADLTTA